MTIISDDPYYCGLRARIPNFAKSKAQKEKEAKYGRIGERRDKEGHPMVWHGPQRGYLENGEQPAVVRFKDQADFLSPRDEPAGPSKPPGPNLRRISVETPGPGPSTRSAS